MKLRLSNVPGRGLAALGLAGLLLTTSGSNLNATSADSRNALVGVWSIQVTLRNCDDRRATRRAYQLARQLP